MFDVRLFEAKIQAFEFDHQLMNMFEFVQCSKNDVRVCSIFVKMELDPSLCGISSVFLQIVCNCITYSTIKFLKSLEMNTTVIKARHMTNSRKLPLD